MWKLAQRTLVLAILIFSVEAQASSFAFLKGLKILVVSGHLRQGEGAGPEQHLLKVLEKSGFKEGYDYEVIVTDPNEASSVAARDVVKALRDSHKPVFIWSYNKGSADVLEALIRYPKQQNKVKGFISYHGLIDASPMTANAKKPLVYSDFQRAEVIPLSEAWRRLWLWIDSLTDTASVALYSFSKKQRDDYLEKNKSKIESIKTRILFVGDQNNKDWTIYKSHPYLVTKNKSGTIQDVQKTLEHYQSYYQFK